jgi:hypothetical protein
MRPKSTLNKKDELKNRLLEKQNEIITAINIEIKVSIFEQSKNVFFNTVV